jgi:hypothetical protein
MRRFIFIGAKFLLKFMVIKINALPGLNYVPHRRRAVVPLALEPVPGAKPVVKRVPHGEPSACFAGRDCYKLSYPANFGCR